MALLDPKLDVVFKMPFAEPTNERLLVSLLEAVLRPPSPIAHIRVLNPDLSKDVASDRGVRLDVLVELADRHFVDVEMECDVRRALPERWLYHWARLFSSRIRRGESYGSLRPVLCIVFLEPRVESTRFHSIYRALEVHDHSTLCDSLELHLVQLPRVEQATDEGEGAQLERWARFLRFEGEEALQSLAEEDPVMAEAKSALEILSREPSAQRIAEMRREAEIERRLDRADARAEGKAEGHAEGKAEGLAEGARNMLRFALRERFGELSERVLARIADADLAQLQGWVVRLHVVTSIDELLAE